MLAMFLDTFDNNIKDKEPEDRKIEFGTFFMSQKEEVVPKIGRFLIQIQKYCGGSLFQVC